MIWAALLAVLTMLPHAGTDVGELRPVQVLYITKDAHYQVRTDTEDSGAGQTLQEALNDLEATASGHIYLNTVDYLILTEETRDCRQELGERLRPSVELYTAVGEIDIDRVGEFLKAHPTNYTLRKADSQIPILSMEEGRYHLTTQN